MNQPNELRIGNVLMYTGSEEGPMRYTIDAEDIRYCEGDVDRFNEVHKPIPITPELLVEVGFQQRYSPRSREFHLHDRMIIFDKNGAFDYAARTRLPYLHTPQNFIYAVAGEELTINTK